VRWNLALTVFFELVLVICFYNNRVKYLRTSDLAKAVGIHPNTVRLYVDWGLIPPVERSPSGYRRFTQQHLDCLRLARLIYSGTLGPQDSPPAPYPGKTIRVSGRGIIEYAPAGDWGGALEKAYQHMALVQAERAQADAAATLLERWARGASADSTSAPLQIGQVSKLLGVSIDILRNWERNGLISVPRDSANGYRRFSAPEISRLRVIRMLSRAGYSLMAILRMLTELDQGRTTGLRQVLDTPRTDEDVYMASDRWISTLTTQEQLARRVIELIEKRISLSQNL
jgi:DNA-binding transcriptional MerR regulator